MYKRKVIYSIAVVICIELCLCKGSAAFFNPVSYTHLPAPDALDAALKRVDYRNVAVEGNTVTLTGGAQLDLGGIAKGYIADCAAAFLRESGIERAVLNLGGNVVVLGSKRGTDGWSVGIQAPFSPEETLSCAVTVADKTVVTRCV